MELRLVVVQVSSNGLSGFARPDGRGARPHTARPHTAPFPHGTRPHTAPVPTSPWPLPMATSLRTTQSYLLTISEVIPLVET
jgi:hypothetical protein